MTTMINLGNYRREKSRVFAGREDGKAVRIKIGLDQLEQKGEVIEINIPEDTLSFNASFFLGLFGKSVRNFGEIGFKEKFAFKTNNTTIKKKIDDGILRALKNSNPLE